MHVLTAEEIISIYKLQRHPEGGYYKETYRALEKISRNALPERFPGSRNFCTAIYFLLEQGNFSAFHRIKSDECWHFYAGQTLHIYIIDPSGELQVVKLGNDILNGESFQFIVPAGYWFASRPASESKFSFVGCTVSPGFDFADFEMADANDLIKLFPQHKILIDELTR